jgi:hypothetical protein
MGALPPHPHKGLCPLTPPKNLLQKVLWNLPKSQKILFIKGFWDSQTLFAKRV